MKKIILMLITIMCISLNSVCIYALTVDDASIIHELNDGESYINGGIRTDISQVQDVGNGYLAYINNDEYSGDYFTTDFVNFRKVTVFNDRESYINDSRAGYMNEIKWADGVYMARTNIYDNIGKSGRVVESGGHLYILDENFQFLKKIEFDEYIREMSYIEGKYYVRITNRAHLRANFWSATADDIIDKVYSSTDLENWEERSDLEHVPLNNGVKTITMKDYNIYLFENDEVTNQIVYEDVKVDENMDPYSDTAAQNVLNLCGEYFYIVTNEGRYYNVCLSVDGVYMTKYNLKMVQLSSEISSLYIDDTNLYIKKSDVDRYLQTGDTYVQLNDKILGFSQPPVTENDRTLVPMRFLLEQMGAEVTWDDATQTATATVPVTTEEEIQTFGLAEEKSVTFSVDNTMATVNGSAATMDVPARLINDKTMVPLRFLSENLGFNVQWDEATRTAIVTTE
ncbi:MAG TPA: copper amine oxidase N-terminal domain-containing protein [Firmicutes bacterium]|nr:copper amine oxidase N-terminal domain-containing protein [Bacillota bacterium]